MASFRMQLLTITALSLVTTPAWSMETGAQPLVAPGHALLTAIYDGNKEEVTRLLATGINPGDVVPGTKIIPLELAKKINPDLFDIMMPIKKLLDAIEKNNDTEVELTTRLVDIFGVIEVKSATGALERKCPFNVAVERAYKAEGAYYDDCNNSTVSSPKLKEQFQKNYTTMKTLLETAANTGSIRAHKRGNIRYFINQAAKEGAIEVIRCLLTCSMRLLDTRDSNPILDIPFLYWAVEVDDEVLATSLLQQGVGVNEIVSSGTTLLDRAKSEGMRELLKQYGGITYREIEVERIKTEKDRSCGCVVS